MASNAATRAHPEHRLLAFDRRGTAVPSSRTNAAPPWKHPKAWPELSARGARSPSSAARLARRLATARLHLDRKEGAQGRVLKRKRHV